MTDDEPPETPTPAEPSQEDVVAFALRHARRVVILVVGSTVVLFGVALLVLPGPGILVILGGIAILAAEYAWARRLLRLAKEGAEQAKVFYNSESKDRLMRHGWKNFSTWVRGLFGRSSSMFL